MFSFAYVISMRQTFLGIQLPLLKTHKQIAWHVRPPNFSSKEDIQTYVSTLIYFTLCICWIIHSRLATITLICCDGILESICMVCGINHVKKKNFRTSTFELINNMDIELWSIPVIDSNHTLIKRVYILKVMVKNICAHEEIKSRHLISIW